MSARPLLRPFDAAASARGKRAAFAGLLLLFAATWIAPQWPFEQALHSSLTVVGMAWLYAHDRRWTMRTRDFVAICGFLAAHVLASRWLYSYVPLDAWSRALLDWSPQATFGLKRNPADRIIHFLFGLCFAPALREHARCRWPTLSARQAFVLALAAIMCTSLAYEWFEWGIALTLSPGNAEAYNGQQGDPWDAHADMLLATLGALLAFPRREVRSA